MIPSGHIRQNTHSTRDDPDKLSIHIKDGLAVKSISVRKSDTWIIKKVKMKLKKKTNKKKLKKKEMKKKEKKKLNDQTKRNTKKKNE